MAKVRSKQWEETNPSPLPATATAASNDSAKGLVDAVGRAVNTAASGAEVGEESAVNAGKTPPDSVEPAVAPKQYRANIYCSQEIPQPFAQAVQELEQCLEMPVWLLIQKGEDFQIDEALKKGFFDARARLPKNAIALVIDSPGGDAHVAYEVTLLLRRCCGAFVAVVPSYAKSAATLLCLGAESILLGEHAQLGPLDVQVKDPEREEYYSALDEVKALDRLHAFALEAIDNTMIRWLKGSEKKISTVFPWATRFIADMMRPLLEKIDAVHYTQMSRMLQVGEEYAIRLMKGPYDPRVAQRVGHYDWITAEQIAHALVGNYPTHPFVIDRDEAQVLGLRLFKPPDDRAADLARIVDAMKAELDKLWPFTAIGQLQED